MSQPHEVYDTRHTVVMSTAHMTEEDNWRMGQAIEQFPFPAYNLGDGCGFMIWLCQEDEELFQEYMDELAQEWFSGYLACAIVRAHNRGFDYLWLDPDGLEVFSLPMADW